MEETREFGGHLRKPDPSGKIPGGVINVNAVLQAASLVGRVVESRLGRKRPLLGGVKLTHDCNLSCVHCPFWKREQASLTFDQAVEALDTLRRMDVRFVIFEGGEPFVWRDGNYTLADVVREAKERFSCVGVTTNENGDTILNSSSRSDLDSCELGYMSLELRMRG